MLYSIGKDSSVMLRLAQKAFYPGPIPFPLLHVDTGYKFREMIEFRDRYGARTGRQAARLAQRTGHRGRAPTLRARDTKRCCGLLKTQALLDALAQLQFDAAFGGARRDEEKSRAKERIYSFRDTPASGTPRTSGPNSGTSTTRRIHPGESIRVFPLSNWTEMDVWQYIHLENIPSCRSISPRSAPMVVRGER